MENKIKASVIVLHLSLATIITWGILNVVFDVGASSVALVGIMVAGLISVLALEVLGELRDKHESLRRANISNEFSVKYASIGQGNGDKK